MPSSAPLKSPGSGAVRSSTWPTVTVVAVTPGEGAPVAAVVLEPEAEVVVVVEDGRRRRGARRAGRGDQGHHRGGHQDRCPSEPWPGSVRALPWRSVGCVSRTPQFPLWSHLSQVPPRKAVSLSYPGPEQVLARADCYVRRTEAVWSGPAEVARRPRSGLRPVAGHLEETDHGGHGVGAADRGQDVEGVLGVRELGVEDRAPGRRPAGRLDETPGLGHGDEGVVGPVDDEEGWGVGIDPVERRGLLEDGRARPRSGA